MKTNRCVTVEEGWPQGSVGSHIAAQLMAKAFDHLDAPVFHQFTQARQAGAICRKLSGEVTAGLFRVAGGLSNRCELQPIKLTTTQQKRWRDNHALIT